ncbi:hypothetical protein [Oceanobacillus sp. CF4.6]|uniref:hypothetical protein n=1 Tax=Oceanobacillus sp. CF4.6 TaxID=3373080 RepID=UPI003EE47637
MNHFLSHTEIANLRHIIEEHERIANQLESLAQTSEKQEISNKLHKDAEVAKLLHQQLLTTFN